MLVGLTSRQWLAAIGVAASIWVASGAQASEIVPRTTWAKPAGDEPRLWSDDKLRAADEFAKSLGTDAYLIVDRGVLVHEYGETSKPMNLASIRKSLLSVMIGMQIDHGVINLDETLADLGIDDKGGLSPTEKSATIRQLMQARSGVYHPAAYETADAKATRPLRGSHSPGEFFYYNNWDFNVLGTIFEKRSGKTVFESLKADLADPLGFQDFRYPQDTEFVKESVSDHPAYAIYLSARDLARVGLLMSRDGMWGEQRLASAKWIEQSTATFSIVPPGFAGYGYLWWTPLRSFRFWKRGPNDVFYAAGDGGQFMMVDRKRDLVIVHRVDNSKTWFKSNRVGIEAFANLAARILDASPDR